MGYYTRFSLETNPTDWYDNITIAQANQIKGLTNGCFLYCFVDGESVKWYSHIEHMIEISRWFPDVSFILRGEGEEAGDVWIEYYKNGKAEHHGAILTFPDPPDWLKVDE